MESVAALLDGIDPAQGEGLVFGPGMRDVAVVPSAGQAGFVWADGTLRGAVDAAQGGTARWFSYAVAACVVQRVPDVVWWLAEIRAVLSSGAAFRLTVPDRRFTRAIARRETALADVLAAYFAGARQPQPREILDFHLASQTVDLAAAWLGRQGLRAMYSLEQATRGIRLAQAADDPALWEVESWVFTPRSFAALMVDLARLGMIWFSCARVFVTVENRAEFRVDMVAADSQEVVEESWRAALVEVVAAERARAVLPQDEAWRLRDELAMQKSSFKPSLGQV